MNCSRLLPAAALLAICFAGCSNTKKSAPVVSTAKHDGKMFVVSVESAAFFRYGPQAGRDPDKTLLKETVVKLIRPSFGYSKVEVVGTGEQGYVASDDIQPATTALIAAASAPKVDMMRTSPDADTTPPEPLGEQFNLNSDDPRLVPPPA